MRAIEIQRGSASVKLEESQKDWPTFGEPPLTWRVDDLLDAVLDVLKYVPASTGVDEARVLVGKARERLHG